MYYSCDAERKFWETHELIQSFLPFLDLKSTLNLAKTNDMTRKTLRGNISWRKLIRRSSPLDGREVITDMVEILKTIEGPEAHLLDLLDAICMRRVPAGDGAWSFGSVKVGCPRHPDSHLIPLRQFELLEEAMGAFGAADMFLEEINTNLFPLMEPCLSILGSTLSRQQEKVKKLNIPKIVIKSRGGAEAFKILIEGSQVISPIEKLSVSRSISQRGWEAIGSSLQLHPGLVINITTLKDALDEAKKEDLKAVWDVLQGHWVVRATQGNPRNSEGIRKQDGGEAGWKRLQQIADMSKDNWAAQLKEDEGGDWVGLRGWM